MKKGMLKKLLIILAGMLVGIEGYLIIDKSISVKYEYDIEYGNTAGAARFAAIYYNEYYTYYEDYVKDIISEYGWGELDETFIYEGHEIHSIATPEGEVVCYEQPYTAVSRLFSDILEQSGNMGFYANVTDKDGNILVESQDMVIANRDNYFIRDADTEEYLDVSKVILLSGIFSDKTLEQMAEDNGRKVIGGRYAIKGTYDASVIYPEELTITDDMGQKTVYKAENAAEYSELEDVVTWSGKGNTQLESIVVQNKYCKSAKEFLNENTDYTAVFDDGPTSDKKDNIFTVSYCSSFVQGDYAVNYSYTFHPILTAMNLIKQELIIIAGVFAAGAIIMSVVCKNSRQPIENI